MCCLHVSWISIDIHTCIFDTSALLSSFHLHVVDARPTVAPAPSRFRTAAKTRRNFPLRVHERRRRTEQLPKSPLLPDIFSVRAKIPGMKYSFFVLLRPTGWSCYHLPALFEYHFTFNHSSSMFGSGGQFGIEFRLFFARLCRGWTKPRSALCAGQAYSK